MKYTTRIAPSPTGDIHIGVARTAYFNWLMARASGGAFILRIDDTDLSRNDQKYVDVILQTMDWLGLDYNRIVYQSKRFDRYKSMAKALVDLNFAKVLDNGAIAVDLSGHTNGFGIKVPTSWHDEIVGDIKITDTNIDQTDGMILIKGDGSPGYNWATVIDDHDFGINYVIRGNDHITNTSKQVILYAVFGAPLPKFAHVGLIHLPQTKLDRRKKLSKRDGAASMLQYKKDGIDPDAMLNFMLRLGWGPRVDDKSAKIIDRDRALKLFIDGGKMRAAPSNMDINALNAYDRKYKARKKS